MVSEDELRKIIAGHLGYKDIRLEDNTGIWFATNTVSDNVIVPNFVANDADAFLLVYEMEMQDVCVSFNNLIPTDTSIQYVCSFYGREHTQVAREFFPSIAMAMAYAKYHELILSDETFDYGDEKE